MRLFKLLNEAIKKQYVQIFHLNICYMITPP